MRLFFSYIRDDDMNLEGTDVGCFVSQSLMEEHKELTFPIQNQKNMKIKYLKLFDISVRYPRSTHATGNKKKTKTLILTRNFYILV